MLNGEFGHGQRDGGLIQVHLGREDIVLTIAQPGQSVQSGDVSRQILVVLVGPFYRPEYGCRVVPGDFRQVPHGVSRPLSLVVSR